jgi:hypothetical protein
MVALRVGSSALATSEGANACIYRRDAALGQREGTAEAEHGDAARRYRHHGGSAMKGTKIFVAGGDGAGSWNSEGVVMHDAPFCRYVSYRHVERDEPRLDWFDKRSGVRRGDTEKPPVRLLLPEVKAPEVISGECSV